MESTLTLSAFVLGITQLGKKLGLQGNVLIVVCVLAGGAASYLIHFQPDLWTSLSGILLSLATAGGVSFVDERIDKLKTAK